MDAYLGLIQQRSKQVKEYPDLYAFPVKFYKKLLKEGYTEEIKKWTGNVNIFEFQLLLFPISAYGHMTLVCVKVQECKIKYYDSEREYDSECMKVCTWLGIF